MSKIRAKDETLGELHKLLADYYIDKLKKNELTAAEASSAVKFLKDNRIESAIEEKPRTEALQNSLPTFTDEDPHEDYLRQIN